jgi:hypothetical protein
MAILCCVAQKAASMVQHSIHHPGVRSTRRLIAARFCWPQMAKAKTLMARACMFCQRGKIHKHVHLQPPEIPVPHRRFAHIHVNLVEPLPPSRSHTYLFTIIDRTSRWPEAVPLPSITAADCPRALFAGWVSIFGVPATITFFKFSLAEAVFGSQLILPGQLVNTAESLSPSFLKDLQTAMTGRPPPPPTRHNSAPAPSTLPEELLLAPFVLARRDGAQPPLSTVHDGPYRVLERSTHFFLL